MTTDQPEARYALADVALMLTDDAVHAACRAAGWYWPDSDPIPSAMECMRPIVQAALDTIAGVDRKDVDR